MERPRLTRIEAKEICIWGKSLEFGVRSAIGVDSKPPAHVTSNAKIIPLNGVVFFTQNPEVVVIPTLNTWTAKAL